MDSDCDHPKIDTASGLRSAVEYALLQRLNRIDVAALMMKFPDLDALADHMLATLPDVHLDDPPIGQCYSAPALARWRGHSRQGIDQQRKAGRLFGVMVDNRWFYPAVQFDYRGRQSRVFATLCESQQAFADSPLEFAVWLETPDEPGGVTPRARLQNAPDTRTAAERSLDNFVPTIVDPPFGAAGTWSDSRK